MSRVYVVMGQCGEYSDREEWPVKAFADETAAEAFVQLCDRQVREARAIAERYDAHDLWAYGLGDYWLEENRELYAEINALRDRLKADPDPRAASKAASGYDAVRYYFFDVELAPS